MYVPRTYILLHVASANRMRPKCIVETSSISTFSFCLSPLLSSIFFFFLLFSFSVEILSRSFFFRLSSSSYRSFFPFFLRISGFMCFLFSYSAPYFSNFFSISFFFFYESRKCTILYVSFLGMKLKYASSDFLSTNLPCSFLSFISRFRICVLLSSFSFPLCRFSFLPLPWITGGSFLRTLHRPSVHFHDVSFLCTRTPRCLLISFFRFRPSGLRRRLARLARASKRDTVSQYLDRGSRDLSLLHAGDSIDGPLTPASCSLSPPSDRSRYRREWRTGAAVAALSLGSSRFRLREATKFVFVLVRSTPRSDYSQLRFVFSCFADESSVTLCQLPTLARSLVFAS